MTIVANAIRDAFAVDRSRIPASAQVWGDYDVSTPPRVYPDDENLHAAADWIERSVAKSGGGGSSTCFSLYEGWHPPYPETTGYIIPTLYRYANRYSKPEFAERATALARWLLSLQFDDGGFPGGDVVPGKVRPASVFNTGQILIGLIAAHEATGDTTFLDSAAAGAIWLATEQDDSGAWLRHAYRPGFSPSYYARVCWPMLMTTVHRTNALVRERALCGLRFIAQKQNENGAIRDWGFAPVRPAFTHTIAYTIRGFLESSFLIPDEPVLRHVATTAAERIFRLFEIRKRLSGAYDVDWRGRDWYVCLTGNCQLAICWLRLFDATGDIRYVNAACKAIDVVTRAQCMKPWVLRFNRGAVPGSSPLFGRYLMFRYPNWAAKFLMDAIMMRNDRLEFIRNHPPSVA